MSDKKISKIIILQESRKGSNSKSRQYFFTVPIKIVKLKGWHKKTKLLLCLDEDNRLFIEESK